MKLDVSLVRQKKDSIDCGLAAMAMIFGYYGIKTDIEKLGREIKIYKRGTYLPQLGSFLIKNGFKVTITTLNPYLFTLGDFDLSQKEIALRFTKLLKKEKKLENKKILKMYLDYLKIGGRIEVKIPDQSDIEEEIKNKRPLLAVLTCNFLEGKTPKFNLHFNVVTGMEGKYVFANDSLWNYRGGKKKYLASDFIYGIHASAYSSYDNGSIVKISK